MSTKKKISFRQTRRMNFPVSSEFAARRNIPEFYFRPLQFISRDIPSPNSAPSRCYIRFARYVLNFAFIALMTYAARPLNKIAVEIPRGEPASLKRDRSAAEFASNFLRGHVSRGS